MSEILEIKSLIEKQGQAWDEFKKTNDELIKAKADGKVVSDLEAKLAKISGDMDNLADLKAQFEEVMTKLQRPGAGGKGDEELAGEVKSFNDMIRADFQSKGKALPAALDVEQYKQYKSGFFKLISGVSIDMLTSDERKAMSAGSEPPRITPAYGLSWPSTRDQTNAVLIRFTAGYANAAAVPQEIKQWMLLRIGMLYENRESVAAGVPLAELPFVDRLLDAARVWG